MDIAGIMRAIKPMRPTHCLELYSIIKRAVGERIKFGECNYTFDGLEAQMTDPHDGQRYRLTITPVKSARA